MWYDDDEDDDGLPRVPAPAAVAAVLRLNRHRPWSLPTGRGSLSAAGGDGRSKLTLSWAVATHDVDDAGGGGGVLFLAAA